MSIRTFFDDDGEGAQIYTGDSVEIYDTGEVLSDKASAQAWVPVAERKPSKSGLYLTTRNVPSNLGGIPTPTLSIVWYDAGWEDFLETFTWEENRDGFVLETNTMTRVITREILAWMPWPKLYSGEG